MNTKKALSRSKTARRKRAEKEENEVLQLKKMRPRFETIGREVVEERGSTMSISVFTPTNFIYEF